MYLYDILSLAIPAIRPLCLPRSERIDPRRVLCYRCSLFLLCFELLNALLVNLLDTALATLTDILTNRLSSFIFAICAAFSSFDIPIVLGVGVKGGVVTAGLMPGDRLRVGLCDLAMFKAIVCAFGVIDAVLGCGAIRDDEDEVTFFSTCKG